MAGLRLSCPFEDEEIDVQADSMQRSGPGMAPEHVLLMMIPLSGSSEVTQLSVEQVTGSRLSPSTSYLAFQLPFLLQGLSYTCSNLGLQLLISMLAALKEASQGLPK